MQQQTELALEPHISIQYERYMRASDKEFRQLVENCKLYYNKDNPDYIYNETLIALGRLWHSENNKERVEMAFQYIARRMSPYLNKLGCICKFDVNLQKDLTSAAWETIANVICGPINPDPFALKNFYFWYQRRMMRICNKMIRVTRKIPISKIGQEDENGESGDIVENIPDIFSKGQFERIENAALVIGILSRLTVRERYVFITVYGVSWNETKKVFENCPKKYTQDDIAVNLNCSGRTVRNILNGSKEKMRSYLEGKEI